MAQHHPATVACALRVAGHLDQGWSDWFDGMAITHEPDGTTRIAGRLADQAALYGLLGKARDLGLTLLGVETYSKNS